MMSPGCRQARRSSMSIDSDRKRLLQGELLAWLFRDLPITQMLTVYRSDAAPTHNYGMLCALIPSKHVAKSLKDPSWDLRHGGGMPGTVMYGGKKERVEYLRYGGDDGIEPLILEREFHGMRDDYI